MIKVLARSIGEYKKASIMTPLLVMVEVILECAIPFVIAQLVNQMQAGCTMDVIAMYGAILIVMSVVSLIFGAAAGFHLLPLRPPVCQKPAQGHGFTRFRTIHLKTLTNFQFPVW